jgi:hypothetical protein
MFPIVEKQNFSDQHFKEHDTEQARIAH